MSNVNFFQAVNGIDITKHGLCIFATRCKSRQIIRYVLRHVFTWNSELHFVLTIAQIDENSQCDNKGRLFYRCCNKCTHSTSHFAQIFIVTSFGFRSAPYSTFVPRDQQCCTVLISEERSCRYKICGRVTRPINGMFSRNFPLESNRAQTKHVG